MITHDVRVCVCMCYMCMNLYEPYTNDYLYIGIFMPFSENYVCACTKCILSDDGLIMD